MGDFNRIIGNEQIKEHFMQAINSRRIPHCYVLDGEEGIGKRMLAEAFAQTLLCEEREGHRPCGRCHACVRFESGNHPDIVYPSHEKPTVFGVDDVREGIVADIQVKPYESEWKIYIIDEAEKLSVSAQNALLKTIEEPPSYGILLFLTTNASALLETIRSRSLILPVRPVSQDEFLLAMRQAGVEEGRLDTLWRFAQGNIGKGLKLAASEDFTAMVALITRLLKEADQMPFSELMEAITALEGHKLDIKDCFGFMRLWYRDVLVFKATRDPNLLVFSKELSAISRIAQVKSYNEINQVLEAIDKASVRLDANVNFQLAMEMLWLEIRGK